MVPLKSGECRAAPGTRPGSYPRPAVRAWMMACARSETCNLVKMLEMWLRTVLGQAQVERQSRRCSVQPPPVVLLITTSPAAALH